MPIRQVDVGDKLRIWRNFQIGKLLVRPTFFEFILATLSYCQWRQQDLTMLDTRMSPPIAV